MKITLSGIVGSGKSTVSKILAEKLHLKRYSVGDLMRSMAEQRGITLQELTELAKADYTIDQALDQEQKKMNTLKESFIMDSRLGFYFIPQSITIFLSVTLSEAAKRIYHDTRGEEKYHNVSDAENYLKKRVDSEKVRYKKYYGIDFPEGCSFDLVIDTTHKSVNDVVSEILTFIHHQ